LYIVVILGLGLAFFLAFNISTYDISNKAANTTTHDN